MFLYLGVVVYTNIPQYCFFGVTNTLKCEQKRFLTVLNAVSVEHRGIIILEHWTREGCWSTSHVQLMAWSP